MTCSAVLSLQRFIMQDGVPTETALRVYRRYLKLEPTHTEEYIAYLRNKVCELYDLAELLRLLTASVFRIHVQHML